jgi:hypothetical protein
LNSVRRAARPMPPDAARDAFHAPEYARVNEMSRSLTRN